MLYILIGLSGILLGFIIGHEYGWTKHSLMIHGKTINNRSFIRRLLFGV